MVELNVEDGRKLLELARESIKKEFNDKELEMPEGEQFEQKKGVFVSVYKNDKIRGCIGLPYPVLPLKKAVIRAANSAAFKDPRFDNLREEEIDNIVIEISILTIPKKSDPNDIDVGNDGLICSYKGYSGLLLPQVAKERDMDKQEFIEAVCNKADLPKSVWQEDECKFWKFKCQIFSELDYNNSEQ